MENGMPQVCKAKIYRKDKTVYCGTITTRCTNKSKDENGFCLQHRKQSEEWIHAKRQWSAIGQSKFFVSYNDDSVEVRTTDVMPIGACLKDVYERFGVKYCDLYHNGHRIDPTTPAIFYLFETLEIIERGG